MQEGIDGVSLTLGLVAATGLGLLAFSEVGDCSGLLKFFQHNACDEKFNIGSFG